MHPVKITIPGAYWDSFLYRGSLYLWDVSGSVRTLNWDALVDEWDIESELQLAMECAFRRSDFLYRVDLATLFRDEDVRDVVQRKFQTLAERSLVASERMLCASEIGQQDNPFPFPHSDLDVYDKRAYVAGPSGITTATIGSGTKHPVSSRSSRQWDAPVQRVAAGWGSLAMAAGDEGLYEFPLSRYSWGHACPDPIQRSDVQCVDCDWAYWSIFASGRAGGYLASFRKVDDGARRSDSFWTTEAAETDREFERIVSAVEVWGEKGYTWGVNDKLCMAVGDTVKVVRYHPWESGRKMEHVDQVYLNGGSNEVVSAATTPFGIIVEREDELVILTSTEEVVTLPGEPANWRVFPRARHYANQLHVIRDDCLEVYSFNDDYLIDQEKKVSGVQMRRGR